MSEKYLRKKQKKISPSFLQLRIPKKTPQGGGETSSTLLKNKNKKNSFLKAILIFNLLKDLTPLKTDD